MALVNCPDCSNQVSDSAPACPHCGRPIAALQIEQTAKKYKGWMAGSFMVSILFFIATAILFGMNKPIWPTFTIAVAALITYLGAVAGAWWRNG